MDLLALIEAGPAILFRCEVQGEALRVTWVSANLAEVTGWSQAEVLQDPNWWARNLHPDDRERATAEAAAALSEGKRRIEFRFRRKSGDYLWIREDLRALPDGTEGGSGLVRCWLDITGDRSRETLLQRLEEGHRDFLTDMPDIYYRCDAEGIIRFVSPAIFDVLGYRVHEVIGQPMVRFYVDPEDRVRFLERLEAGGGRISGNRAPCRRKDGTISARGAKNMATTNRAPALTAVSPVRPPVATPAALST